VRQGQQNRRGRGRNNNNRKGHHHNPLSRSFESNGPDVKIRGTPAHIAEKYISLARDAQSTGDPVLAENYLQHAEHYSRIIMAYRDQFNQQQGGEAANGGAHRMRVPGEGSEGFDEFGDDGDMGMGGEDGFQQPFVPPGQQPQPRPQGGGEHHGRPERQDHRQEQRHPDQRSDRPFRRDQNRPRYGERGDRGERQGFAERERQPDTLRAEPRGEARQEPQERAPEQVAETTGEPPRRRERFQQVHEQPEFLRRPVRRARNSENAESGSKGEPTGD
jgi:hypothetical protein